MIIFGWEVRRKEELLDPKRMEVLIKKIEELQEMVLTKSIDVINVQAEMASIKNIQNIITTNYNSTLYDIKNNKDVINKVDKDLVDLERAVQIIIHNEGLKDKLYGERTAKV
jgi:predicted polyphosphate/ATP-dependent NAD kinase